MALKEGRQAQEMRQAELLQFISHNSIHLIREFRSVIDRQEPQRRPYYVRIDDLSEIHFSEGQRDPRDVEVEVEITKLSAELQDQTGNTLVRLRHISSEWYKSFKAMRAFKCKYCSHNMPEDITLFDRNLFNGLRTHLEKLDKQTRIEAPEDLLDICKYSSHQ